MASLLQKFRTFTLSNLHSLLDAAIDLNSVEAIKQHVRDLETAHRQVLGSLAAAKGNLSALTSYKTQLERKIESLTADIETLLSDDDPNNDHFANPLAEQIGDCEAELEVNAEELSAAQTEVDALTRAESQLQSKLSEMKSQLRRLKSLERAAKAKERAASAVTRASDALSSGVDASVDSATQRLRQRAATADASFDQAMGGLQSAGGAEAALRESRASSRVAQIRARLAAKRAATPAPSPTNGTDAVGASA